MISKSQLFEGFLKDWSKNMIFAKNKQNEVDNSESTLQNNGNLLLTQENYELQNVFFLANYNYFSKINKNLDKCKQKYEII